MKKVQILGLLALAIAPFAADAQIGQMPIHTGGRQAQLRKHDSQAATGSKYYTETYMPAQVEGKPEKILVRYNVYDDQFEMQDPYSKETAVMAKTESEKIIFMATRKAYTYTAYETEKGDKVSGYLNIVAQTPNTTIYRRERIALMPEKMPSKSYDTYKAPEYKPASEEFYIAIGNGGEVKPLPDNKKDFAKLFSAKEKEVLSFIKDNKIDLDEEQDLVKLGQYLKTI